MPTLALCSISALDRPLAAAAALAAKHDLALELTARAPHLTDSADASAVREAAAAVRDAGVSLVAFGSYLGSPERHEPAHAHHAVEVAAALGASRLRTWAGEGGDADAFRATVELLGAACDAAADHGIDVVVERHVGSFADTEERTLRLLEAVGRPNFALNYQPLDFLPKTAVAGQPEDARRLAPHARYLHLKNFRENPDATGPLLPLGSLEHGVLDLRAILAAALQAGYAGPLAIEFLSAEPISVEEKLEREVAWLRGVLRELVP